MRKITITINQSIYINRPREVVWDFTQDYSLRPDWDKTVIEAKVLQTTPQKIVELKTSGNTIMTFVYKVNDRPKKTTLAIHDLNSNWIYGGGGSWKYEDQQGGTLWSQTNTLILKSNIFLSIFRPVITFIFKNQTRQAMQRAKMILEGHVRE